MPRTFPKPLILAAAAPFFLGACDTTTEPSFFFGSTSATQSANGAEYASEASVLSDLEGEELTVRLARFETNNQTGKTKLLISTETVTFDPGALADGVEAVTISYKGETLVFASPGDGYFATLSTGQEFYGYENDSATYSAVYAIYSYQNYFDAEDVDHTNYASYVDTEGFYAVGFETSPTTVDARISTATYSGNFSGYGQALDLDGSIIQNEISISGGIGFLADFDSNTVSGAGSAFLGPDELTFEFANTDIIGNGFSSDLTNTSCDAATCTSNSSLGGVFFGPSGEEITGVIGFDETYAYDGELADDSFQFIGAAGFVTQEDDIVVE